MEFQMWVWGASPEETACLAEVAGSPWVGGGMAVSVDGEVQSEVACLLAVELAACLDQKVAVQKGAEAGVPSSSRREAAGASGVAVGLLTLQLEQGQVWM